MESSSENSFAWTDTSSDSINSTSMAASNIDDKSNERLTANDGKIKKDRKSKKKHSDEFLTSESKIVKDEKASFEISSNSSKKRKIKIEPDSDNDILRKKKKKVKHSETNGDLNDSLNSMPYDETFLDMKEKHKPPQIKNSNTTHSFVTEDNSLQEESEESGCDEISTIKCDDSQSAHTISFIDKSIQDENTRVNGNDSLNIITKLTSIVPEQDSYTKLKASQHRKQRLSDRIRFEEDDDDDDNSKTNSSYAEHASSSETNKKPLKLRHFLKTHPNLKLLAQTYNNNTNVTRDDEIWILKCSREVNIADFNNTNLNIHGKCKIKVGGQTYEGSAEEDQSATIVSLLAMEHSKYKIRNVPLNGIINLRKRIPKAHFRDDNIMVNNQTNFIPLPETKCRHPLFGSNYKKALKIPAAIAERLKVQDSDGSLIRTKKKKKNKTEKIPSEEVDPQVQTEILMKTEPELPVEIREKKKKKRKIIDDEEPVPKKVKRIKHDPESAEAWESEKAIEENLFNF